MGVADQRFGVDHQPGLALSREYVEQFGGRLDAANRPEGGARFTVALNVAAPERARQSA